MGMSRNEDILQAIIDGTDTSALPVPQSREEALLLAIKDKIEEGGGWTIKDLFHICVSGEYDPTTRVPIIANPDEHLLYLVPSPTGKTGDLYDEWLYADNKWENVGKVSFDFLTQFNVESNTLAPGSSATVTKTVNQQTGDVLLTFGIPQGDPGVYYGTSEPTDENINVWINPNGESWEDGKIDEIADEAASIVKGSFPHNYEFDGTDLSTVFADADALYNAYTNNKNDKIHVGDYWPVTLNGTYRDYGQMTAPSGISYYSDTSLSQYVGTLNANYTATSVENANIPGGHEDYCSIKIGNDTYYVAYDSCLDYLERTLSNALMKFEVAGINNYWRYGDSGSDNFTSGRSHMTLQSRDGLPHTLKMRKQNQQWETLHIDTFTGDGTTSEFTLSGTVGTIGYVFVDGTRKTYDTDYTYASNKITFKSGKIPAASSVIKVEWMDGATPWTGSAVYRTFNDPDYGIINLIKIADQKLYNHIYKGPNNKGMRYYGETRTKTGRQGGAWTDRGLLFFPTENEIWGRNIYSSWYEAAANQLQWPLFEDGGRRHFTKGAGNAASRYTVWCASSTSITFFASVYSRGDPDNNYATYSFASAPGFIFLFNS